VELASGWCAQCETHVDFERPTCVDHPEECPELVCLDCGTAYVGGDVVFYIAAMSATPTNAVVTPAA
jgi:hypothetical protein